MLTKTEVGIGMKSCENFASMQIMVALNLNRTKGSEFQEE